MAEREPEIGDDAQALFAHVRSLQPAAGARERVLDGATRAIAGERRARLDTLAPWAGATAAAAVAAVALLWPRSDAPATPVRVLAAVDVGTQQGALQAGDALGDRAIAVGARGRLQLALPRARVGVQGPARIELARGALVVHDGSAEVDGVLAVRGASCRATVNGRCAVSRAGAQLHITLFAGSVQAEAPQVACSIVDLSERTLKAAGEGSSTSAATVAAPARPSDPGAQAVPAAPEAPESGVRAPAASDGARAATPARARTASTAPSELALQVQAYRVALALRGRDDARAIELFREMNRRWPRGPLRHEIDLNVVDALVRAGRSAEAAVEARRFLARHPHSTKADEIRKLLGAFEPARAADRENIGAE